MIVEPMPVGDRGLHRYADFVDLNNQRVRVQQSSLATSDAVWVFVGAPGVSRGAQLDESMARALIDGLQAWLSSLGGSGDDDD